MELNDEASFEKIFIQWHKSLWTYALSVLKDQDTATEVVQNAFCRMWEKRATLKVHISIKAYLYGAVYHECINWMRQEKKLKDYRSQSLKRNEQADTGLASARIEMEELEKRFQQALDKLPEQCRAIFLLSRFSELKYREISEQLGIAVKTVEAQVSKALKLLRAELAGYLE